MKVRKSMIIWIIALLVVFVLIISGAAGTLFRFMGEGLQRDSNEHPNYRAAATFDRIAIALGNARASTNLGILYMNGWGVEKDEAEAESLFTKAYDKSDEKAPRYLGLLAAEGADYQKAAEWFSIGADRGDITSKIELGKLYLNGDGVEQDYVKARELFEAVVSERQDHAAEEAVEKLAEMNEKGI